MTMPYLSNGEHFELIAGVDINEMSPLMHEIGLSLGETTVEHGLLGYGDENPMRVHSEIIYHENLLPYFMLGCVKPADVGGANVIYDAVKAATIIAAEQPELAGVTMVYHAEHYPDTKAVVPLVRHKRGEDFLSFRQKKGKLNEILDLPEGWVEEMFYAYIDSVLVQCIEFERILKTGEVLLVDNYKTLHVRTAYEGLRKVIRVRVDDPEAHQNYIV